MGSVYSKNSSAAMLVLGLGGLCHARTTLRRWGVADIIPGPSHWIGFPDPEGLSAKVDMLVIGPRAILQDYLVARTETRTSEAFC